MFDQHPCHSGCKTAIIRFSHEEGKIRVFVQDHGKGMSPEQLSEIHPHSTGVGIMGMRERSRPFGGELVIDSDDSGTRVSAILPSKVQSESGN